MNAKHGKIRFARNLSILVIFVVTLSITIVVYITNRAENPREAIWHWLGRTLPSSPALALRVNYGQDWVESFYEGGHRVSIRVADSEGIIKAVAEVVTEATDFLGGETGFKTTAEDWFPSQPDLQPYDLVYVQVDNGALAQVQIGDVSGMIDIGTDSIGGTITVPWITDPVSIECLDSDSEAEPLTNKEGGSVLTTGNDPYSCSWEGKWDIQPGQTVSVGYVGPDGHWVANVFVGDSTIVVTSTEDVVANDGVCALREAISAANINTSSGNKNGECSAGMDSRTDTIVLAAGKVYSLTINRRNTDTDADGDLDVRNNSSAVDLVIKVAGDGKATISQDASVVGDRVLENQRATLKIENLILTGGNNVGIGGGLLNSGTIDMFASEVRGNSAEWEGGGIHNSSAGKLRIDSSAIVSNSSAAFAGGIMNKGTLTMNNSEVTANRDIYGGGGIKNEGTLTVDHSALSANSSGQGGALYNAGTANITNGTLVGSPDFEEGNTASDGGGGLFNVGTMTVESSTVSGNWGPYGGGLFNWIGGRLTISNSTVSGNRANQGGGLHNKEGSTAIIQNGSIFANNYAEWSGGGIDNGGKITITESILRGNTSHGVGDALHSTSDIVRGTVVTESCIVGNEDIAVFNERSASQNATGNWWGDPSGPSGRGIGFGDSVGNAINYSNWLIEPPSICASN